MNAGHRMYRRDLNSRWTVNFRFDLVTVVFAAKQVVLRELLVVAPLRRTFEMLQCQSAFLWLILTVIYVVLCGQSPTLGETCTSIVADTSISDEPDRGCACRTPSGFEVDLSKIDCPNKTSILGKSSAAMKLTRLNWYDCDCHCVIPGQRQRWRKEILIIVILVPLPPTTTTTTLRAQDSSRLFHGGRTEAARQPPPPTVNLTK